jgi:hypothetical protein
MQLLACHQQKLKTNNLTNLKNRSIFDRNKEVHKILQEGNVNEFKDFIKYSNEDILKEYDK